MCVNKEVSLFGVSFVGSAFSLVSFGADTVKPHAVTCPRISIFPLLLFLFRLFFFYCSFHSTSPATSVPFFFFNLDNLPFAMLFPFISKPVITPHRHTSLPSLPLSPTD